MRARTLLLLAAAVVLAVPGSVAGADNTAPLADAGVDQTVPVNATVYLDGNGSVDPDGEITSVTWTIEMPDGGTMTPNCGECRRTKFDATAAGQYAITLTVTDDDGATRSDTLYVSAVTGTGPDVSLSGPTTTAPETDATFTANVSSDGASLQSLTWLVNGSVVERTSMDGASTTTDFTHSFDTTGEASVRAVAYDTLGNRESETRRVSIGGGDSSETDAYTEFQCFDGLCGNGSDKVYTDDGETVVVDTNDQEGIQLYSDSELTDYGDNLFGLESTEVVQGTDAIRVTEGSLSDITTESYETDDPMNSDQTSSGSSLGSDGIGGVVDDTIDGIRNTNDDVIADVPGASNDDDGSVSFGGITIGGGDEDSDGDGSADSSDDGGNDSDGGGGLISALPF